MIKDFLKSIQEMTIAKISIQNSIKYYTEKQKEFKI